MDLVERARAEVRARLQDFQAAGEPVDGHADVPGLDRAKALLAEAVGEKGRQRDRQREKRPVEREVRGREPPAAKPREQAPKEAPMRVGRSGRRRVG